MRSLRGEKNNTLSGRLSSVGLGRANITPGVHLDDSVVAQVILLVVRVVPHGGLDEVGGVVLVHRYLRIAIARAQCLKQDGHGIAIILDREVESGQRFLCIVVDLAWVYLEGEPLVLPIIEADSAWARRRRDRSRAGSLRSAGRFTGIGPSGGQRRNGRQRRLSARRGPSEEGDCKHQGEEATGFDNRGGREPTR